MRKKLILMAAVLLPMLFMVGRADDGVWQPLNPAYFMNQVMSIDVGYTESNQKRIYAAEGAANGRIWISDNDGETWQRQDPFVPDHGFCKVFVQKSNLQCAWALSPGNYYSDNQAGPFYYNPSSGQWEHRISGLNNYMRLFSMAVDYSSYNLERALVGGGNDEGSGPFFFLTTNGVDWSQPNWIDCNGVPIPPSIMPHNFIQDIAFAPSDSRIAYFIMNSDENVSNFKGLFKSTDGGQTWSCANFWGVYLNDNIDPDWYFPYALAVDPNDANRVAVSVCCGAPDGWWIPGQRIARILISTEINGNREWVQLYQHPSGDHVCNSLAFSSDGSSLYAAFESKLNQFNRPEESYVVRIDGTIPHELPSGEQPGDKRSLCVAVDPLDNANVYVGTEHVIYRSSNYGDDIQPIVDGADVVTDIKRVNAQTPYLFFMTDDPPLGSIYRSTDLGQNWMIRRDGWSIINSTCIQADPSESGLMFAASTNNALDPYVFSTIHKSTDYGENWFVPEGWFSIEDPGFFMPGKLGMITCLAVDTSNDPFYHDYIYFGVSGDAAGLYYSATSGSDPNPFANYDPPDADPQDIAVHPTQSATIVVADGNNGLYRTTDHIYFSSINGDLPISSANKFKYCPGQPTMALVATPYGIFKSHDVNLSSPHWSQANPPNFGGPVIDMDFHSADNSIVCFCAAGLNSTLFYISADSARSWLSFNLGYDGHNFRDLSIDANNTDAFYAATDAGVYKLNNPVKSGVLWADETWGPGTVIVNGDVNVPFGVTLTIAPGTTVKFVYNFDKRQTGSDINKSELLIQGKLQALGEDTHPIVFESSSLSGTWSGIMAETYSNIDMDYCTIRNAVYGIYAYKPAALTVDNCIFQYATTAGIYITGNANPVTPAIRNTQIQNCGTY